MTLIRDSIEPRSYKGLEVDPVLKSASELCGDKLFSYSKQFHPSTFARLMLSFVPFLDFCGEIMPKVCSIGSFGSGSCTHETMLAALYSTKMVTCYDISDGFIPPYTVSMMQELGNIGFLHANFEQGFFASLADKFDLVFSIQTLEHIEAMEAALENQCNAVKRGGYCYVDTPFFSEIEEAEPDLAALKARAWELHKHYHLGFSRIKMENRLARLGFRILKSGYYAYFGGDSAILKMVRSMDMKKPMTPAQYHAIIEGLEYALLRSESAHRQHFVEMDSSKNDRRVCSAIRILAEKV